MDKTDANRLLIDITSDGFSIQLTYKGKVYVQRWEKTPLILCGNSAGCRMIEGSDNFEADLEIPDDIYYGLNNLDFTQLVKGLDPLGDKDEQKEK